MLNTELLGDPVACRETGEWMIQVATSTFNAATLLNDVHDRTHQCWRGPAATAFEEYLGRGGREADQLSREITRAGRALITFSEELGTAAARLHQAREVAAAAGLTVTPQGIEPPSAVTVPAEPTTAQQFAAVDTYQAQVRAWNEVHQTVGYARGIELAAHERLEAATNTPKSLFESLRNGSGFIAAGSALSAAANLHIENSRFRQLSGRHAQESLTITKQLADSPSLTKAERIRLQTIRNAISERAVKEHRIAQSQARLLGGVPRTTSGRTVLQAIAWSPADGIRSSSVFAQTGKVLGTVPYVGMGLALAQASLDTYHGKPADQAFGSAAASALVGTGVTSGLLAVGASAALAGGPFTLVAVGVGMTAACGVGYLVDQHWDDISDATGDSVAAIGDGVRTAAHTVGGWLGG